MKLGQVGLPAMGRGWRRRSVVSPTLWGASTRSDATRLGLIRMRFAADLREQFE
jgi:hypothetical protein